MSPETADAATLPVEAGLPAEISEAAVVTPDAPVSVSIFPKCRYMGSGDATQCARCVAELVQSQLPYRAPARVFLHHQHSP